MKKFFFLLILILSFQTSYSQVFLSGYIQENGSEEKLPFANVIISELDLGTTTNENGYFTLNGDIKEGMVISASYVGYKTESITITNQLLSSPIEINLVALTSTLNEVVIAANSNKFLQTNTEISRHQISTKQINLMPSIGEVDIFRSLQLLPGVSGTSESTSGLHIRGGTPEQNLVLLDGIKVYNVEHFFGFFSAFNANAIKSVDLYKGAFPARYGGRLSGVIDMIGRTGSFNELKGQVTANLLSAGGSIEIPFKNKFSLLIAGRRSFTDLLKTSFFEKLFNQFEDDSGNIEELEEFVPSFNFFDFNSKLSYKPSNKDLITFSYYKGQDNLDEISSTDRLIYPDIGPEKINILGDVSKISKWGNDGYGFKWSRQWNPKFYNVLNISYSEYFNNRDDNYSVNVNIPDTDSTILDFKLKLIQKNNVKDFTARYDGEFVLRKNNNLEFGLEYTKSSVDYTFVRDDTLNLITTDQDSKLYSYYLSYNLNSVKNLKIKLGMRGNRYDFNKKNYFSPRASLDYKIFENLKLKLGYGAHYQFVKMILGESVTSSSRDFWLLANGEDVKIGKATHYVAGISYERDAWLIDFEGFYKELENLTEFSLRYQSSNLRSLFFNGSGEVKGFEVLLQKKIEKYTGWISYTYTDVEHLFPLLNEGKKFPGRNTQKNEFKIFNNYEINGWNFSVSFIYGSGQPYTEPSYKYNINLLDDSKLSFIGVGPKNGSLLPDYHRMDIGVHHIFTFNGTKGDIGLSIFNIYNRANVWYYEYDFNQEPVLKTRVKYLGFVPNINLKFEF